MSKAGPSPSLPLFIGCPVWNCDSWGDVVFPRGTKRSQWLSWYTQMFNCVEGNSSFYAIPTVASARRWASESATGFKFCMKFPREISHDRALIGTQSATSRFMQALEELALAQRLGPTFLQLGPAFAADRFDVLAQYLTGLSRDFPWAVEVRHPSWYDGGTNERRLNELLTSLEIDTVIFDSRPLFVKPPDDDSEKKAQTRKPKTPFRTSVTGSYPLVRFIGRNHPETVDRFIDEWLPTISSWVDSGRKPFIFTHTPDDTFAPALARRMWERLRTVLPGNSDSLPIPPQKPRQLELL